MIANDFRQLIYRSLTLATVSISAKQVITQGSKVQKLVPRKQVHKYWIIAKKSKLCAIKQLFFFVVLQGIRDPGRTQQKNGGRGFILLPPCQLCCPDQMLVVMELSQHLVSSSKTVRPIISQDAPCVGQV